MLRVSSVLGVLTGLLLAAGEVQANWGDWQWWPWWLVDFVAAALLVAGGLMSLRKHPKGPLLLAMAWTFTAGMVWMSLAGNIADGVDAGRDARMAGSYVYLLSALLATSIIGALLTFVAKTSQSKV